MKKLYLWSYSAKLNNRVVSGLVEAPNSTLAEQAVKADNELNENIRICINRDPNARFQKHIKWVQSL